MGWRRAGTGRFQQQPLVAFSYKAVRQGAPLTRLNLYLMKLPDGTVIWTSPTGQTYRTSPGGADLFPDMGRPPACAAPKPLRRNRSRERTTRIARIRNRNRMQRPINEAHRRLQQAHAREIYYRETRNRMRKTLFILKGRPSTSPFCKWINDPLEPEELPPDWRPPPEPPPGPVDPPF